MMLGALDDAALDAFTAPIRPGAPVLFGELRHLGGALARIPAGAGSLGRLDGEYLMFGAGLVMAPEMAAPVRHSLDALKASLAAYDTGSAYLNFVEEPTDTATLFAEDAYLRLREIRAAVDPDDRMVGNHPIPA
jgi:hypothetical protein